MGVLNSGNSRGDIVHWNIIHHHVLQLSFLRTRSRGRGLVHRCFSLSFSQSECQVLGEIHEKKKTKLQVDTKKIEPPVLFVSSLRQGGG